MFKTAEEILEEEINAVKAISLKNMEDAVNLIMECKAKIVFTGMGKAGLIARKVSATFASTGTPAFFMHPCEAQHGDLGMLGKRDLIVAFSNSGKTREIIESVLLARELFPKIKVLTVTSDPKAELSKLSHVVIETGGYPEVCPLGMAPTCSTTAMLVIGDILAMMTMERKGFTAEDYAMRHHGGYLGQKARGEI